MQQIKSNLLLTSIICLTFGAILIVSKEALAISIGAPISVCGIIMFIWGMSLNSEESGWSSEKIAEWTPSSEEMVEAGRVDHANHATNAHRMVTDGVAFANAVRVADEMTDDSGPALPTPAKNF